MLKAGSSPGPVPIKNYGVDIYSMLKLINHISHVTFLKLCDWSNASIRVEFYAGVFFIGSALGILEVKSAVSEQAQWLVTSLSSFGQS